MDIVSKIHDCVVEGLGEIYSIDAGALPVNIGNTRKEFTGDYTIVLFPLLKATKTNPNQLGESLGDYLKRKTDVILDYNIIKGFLNVVVRPSIWLEILEGLKTQDFRLPSNGQKKLVEFSSPNTNKPLHLGHIRNILLGWSCSQIFDAAGYDVIKTQIINDRGIAICKSMIAWQKFSDGETPDSSGIKPDHFVGKYYVIFDQKFREEYAEWQKTVDATSVYNDKKKDNQSESDFFKEYKNSYFNEYSQLGKDTKEMLRLWEAEDTEVRALWKKMNDWVYSGFDITYEKLGVDFDSFYYESDTYKLGKDIIDLGLEKNVFYKKDDGSVWIDLEKDKLDHKLVLRSDGTSVYMTQDLGTAHQRYLDTKADGMVYVVADEQNYHFKALFAILKALEEPYWEGLFHLSYGMVDLPSGRMKSREGTVVDADDLIKEVINEARNNALERGELEGITSEEAHSIYEKIGKAALKFFILKVNPKKRMVFNPSESVDMQGATGPYVQNAYVRIRSIERKADSMDLVSYKNYTQPEQIELEVIKQLYQYKSNLLEAAKQYDPSVIAAYAYDLAKLYHKFYHDVRILGAASEEAKSFRIELSKEVARTLKASFGLLGIEMPERM